MTKDELDILGKELVWGLELKDKELVKKGLLNFNRLDLKDLNGGRLLTSVYNKVWRPFEQKTVSINDDSFNDLIFDLLFKKEPILLRKHIDRLGYGFKTTKNVKAGYSIVDEDNSIYDVTKIESIILRYDKKQKLYKYLYGVIQNYILNYRKTLIKKNNKHIHLDLIQDIGRELQLSAEEVNPQSVEVYKDLKKGLVKRARDYLLEYYNIILSETYIEIVYELIGEEDLKIEDVENISGNREGVIELIWEALEVSTTSNEIVESRDLDRYLEDDRKVTMGYKEVRKKSDEDYREIESRLKEIGYLEKIETLKTTRLKMVKC